MTAKMYRASLFALYQSCVVLGILLLPIALAANRVGITLPIGQLIKRLDSAYEQVEPKN